MSEGVALVTGASRGIGQAIAVRLSADGWTVGVNYRSDDAGAKQTCDLIAESGGTAFTVVGDVGQSDDVEEMFRVCESHGTVSVLVNNAGHRRDGLAMRMSESDFDDVLRTNLTGAFLTSKRAMRSMLTKRFGRIVNIASVVGVNGNAGQANYAAAKAGLIGFTKSIAREVAAKSITANAVAPGFVRTALTEGLDEKQLAAMVAATPMRREILATEVAEAVAFLASPAASGITGQVLCVDGGMTA